MGETPPLPLPEHPELRELAQALEDAGVAAEILDYKWRVVYTTSEDALALGLDPAREGCTTTTVCRWSSDRSTDRTG